MEGGPSLFMRRPASSLLPYFTSSSLPSNALPFYTVSSTRRWVNRSQVDERLFRIVVDRKKKEILFLHAVLLVDSFNMEKSILVEGNHQGDSTLASKSSKALIKIDSISIDLVNANEKNEVETCEHFSIRGYVAEIRKKDRKICWPFSIAGKHNKLDEQICTLPPLDVTKFRWWRCQNCLHEIDAEGTAKEIGMVPNCCNTGCNSTGTCSHMSSHHDAAMLPSDFQQASKLDSNVGRKADANTSAYVDSDPYLPSCNDKKEKKAEVVWTTIMGHENGSNVDANQEILRPTCAATMFNPCQMRERHTDDTVVLKLKCNGSVESCKPNCGIHEVAENGLVIRDLKCMDNSSTDIVQTEKEISVDDQHKDTITALGTSRVVCELNGPSFAAKVHTNEQSSLELDTRDYASSEGDEILVENDLQDQHHDNSGGFHHRKTQKVRLLTELLGANGNENAGHIRIENDPSNTSAGVDSPSISQVQVAVEGNIGRGFKGQNKKRKMPRDEDWRPPEMICPNNVNKKVKTFKGDAENTAVAVASSKAEEDSFAGIVSQAGTKNHLTLHGFDGNPIPMKKKLKKTQADEGCSCLVPLREVVCKENPDKYGVADKSTTAHNDALKGRVVDPLLKNFLPAQRTVRKSILCKKKNKMPQVENMQASLRPWNDGMLRKGPIMGKNVEIMQTGPELVSFKSVQGAAAGIGSYLSLESYLAAQKNNRNIVPQIENGLDSLLPWHEVTFREDQTMRKDVGIKHVGESSVPLKSVADARVEIGGHCDLNLKKTTHGTSLRSKKQNCTSLVEDGDCSLMWKTDFSGTSNNEKTIAVQEHSEVTKKHSDQRADKMFEQGALDDIPMEIVELMAKNQYERRLQDTENNHCPLGTTYRPRNGETMDFAAVYGNGASRVLQEENPHLRKPQPRNARKGIFTTGENVGPAKQKSIGYFPIVGHPEGTHASRGFGAFSQCREQLSSEVQFCAPWFQQTYWCSKLQMGWGYFGEQVLSS
ncbi:hypothetical protein L1049_018766 [Liquidambar formosana]|uniref:Uncharacterized protein n=1 Tax=Liquidambar formosana TaxID=63359 RepID=A0AAP0WMP1_LIQFO